MDDFTSSNPPSTSQNSSTDDFEPISVPQGPAGGYGISPTQGQGIINQERGAFTYPPSRMMDTTVSDANNLYAAYNTPKILVALAKGGMGAVQRLQQIATSGERMGASETAAGVKTIAADKYPTSGNVGEYLNTLEGQLDASLERLKNPPLSQQPSMEAQDLRGLWVDATKQTRQMGTNDAIQQAQYLNPDSFAGGQSGTITDATTAKTAKDISDYIQQNPNLVGKSKNISVQAYRVSQKASQLLNGLVPGRAEASADFRTLSLLKAPINLIAQALKLPVEHPGQAVGLAAGIKAIQMLRELAGGSK